MQDIKITVKMIFGIPYRDKFLVIFIERHMQTGNIVGGTSEAIIPN
jgi:hypothetical protein